MPRGVDSELFHPGKRDRGQDDGELLLGYVGRLSVEKNVRLLAQVQRELEARSFRRCRFLVVGHGDEESWLRRNLPGAKFTGVLRGEALARAYANMDVFVFPSHTDTFGNVVLEALASGVPAIVTPDGGPASIVRDGVNGRVTSDKGFAETIKAVVGDPILHSRMCIAARRHAVAASWQSVFEGVYSGYKFLFGSVEVAQKPEFGTSASFRPLERLSDRSSSQPTTTARRTL